nr:zinc finger BED domain-containing protein 1-like [Megalopta genalis]
MPKARAKRSAIWLHFSEFVEHGCGTMVKCNACNLVLPYCRNTTNLWSHIRIHHKKILGNIAASAASNSAEAERPSVSGRSSAAASSTAATQNKVQPYSTDSQRAQEITNSLLLMIAGDVHAFSIVNGRGFVGFVKTLDERYTLPSRNALTSKYLPVLYATTCKTISEKLSRVDSIHLAIDSWTEANQKMSFLAITAHYFAEEALQENTLQVSYVPDRHAAENLHEIVERTAEMWRITGKIRTIVLNRVDSVTSASSAASTSSRRQIFCFASALNMAVHEAIQGTRGVLDVFEKCRDIVDLCRSSHVVAEALKNERARQNLSKPACLKRDVAGNWRSTYSMLCGILDQRSILSAMRADQSQVPCLSPTEWTVIAGTVQVLKPLFEATEEVSGDSNVAISKIIPIVHCVRATLGNQEALPLVVTSLRVRLLNELDLRFENIETHPVYSVATFLDPRYKNIAFRSDESVALVQNQLISRCRFWENGNGYCGPRATATKPEGDDNAARLPNDTLWAEFDKKVQEAAAETECLSNSLKDELERYLRLKLINRKSNPISWWNTEGRTMFPKLMKIALEYLCVPAICVSNESLFSKVGQIFSHRRTRIQPKYVNMLSMLHLNQGK